MTSPFPPVRSVRVGSLELGGGGPLFLLAGPCVIEGRDFALETAKRLAAIARERGIPFVYKSSYDKANRTSGSSFRGPGLGEGLGILAEVRAKVGVPVLTDVHTEEQALAAGKVVDCVQIPAFLCRQTDLLFAAASTGKAVNIKKGQFLSPEEMKNALEKVTSRGNENALLTERGTFFGYGRLVVDMTGIPAMRAFGHPVVMDGTHSVQRPGGLGDRTGGDRRLVPTLVRAAVAAGCDGLFLETHPDPDRAPSDGPNMVRLDDLAALLDEALAIRRALGLL
ncbi:MAG TPA: 3-deoxy-8-phosphooctulonate synthase [Planctomycetota bacterium]|nr:3-deoxy-8-phosphooctulonate synthase [Planctomycetota bacterium]